MDAAVPMSFGMFSAEGDAAVRDAVAAAVADLRGGVDRESVLSSLRLRTAAILELHEEIADTDVREQIAEALAGPLNERGLAPIESGDEVVE